MKRRIARIVGWLVGLAGLYYVTRLVLERRAEAGRLVEQLDAAPLLAALAMGLAGMTLIGLAWNLLLGALDRRLGTLLALRAYFVGQLGKYVPGGVWAIVGRGEWARREHVAPTAAYTSTVMSMVTAYIAASLVALVLLPAAGELATQPLVLGVACLGILGLAATHPRVLAAVIRLGERLTRRSLPLRVPRYGATVRAVAIQSVTWVLIGTGTWLVAGGLGFDLAYVDVVVATAVGWVIGLLALPVPGGIGVREGVFVAVLGASGDAATIALASRLVAVAVDITGALLSTAAVQILPRRSATASDIRDRTDHQEQTS